MDFGFNNIAPSRDPGPGPASRKTDVADTGFADILGAALNASEDARDTQPANASTYPDATPERTDPATPPRETAPPAKHDTKEPHKPEGTKPGQAEDSSNSPVAEAPAHNSEEPQAAPAQDSKPASEKTETQAQTTETHAQTSENGTAAPPASATPTAPASTLVPQVPPVVGSETSAAPQATSATAPAVSAAAPTMEQPAAPDLPVAPQSKPASDTVASTPGFETHLQTASAQTSGVATETPAAPPQPGPDKAAQAAPSTVPKTEPVATQITGQESASPAQAPSPAPGPAAAPAPQTAAPAAPATAIVTAQTSPAPAQPDPTAAAKAPAADAAQDIKIDDADAASIIVFTRPQTTATGASTQQAAATDAALRAAANGATGATANEIAEDPARAATTSGKADTASRPLGPLAPATGLAAQTTAQNAASGVAKPSIDVSPETQAKAETDHAAANTGAEALKLDTASAHAKADAAMTAEIQAIRTNGVDAPAAAARAGRSMPHSVVSQIAPHIAQAAADGNDRINIRLSPADLGRVEVKLEFGPDGRVQAVFAADRPQTVDLLQRDARDLERALQDAGLRADSGSLSFNLRGENREQPQRFGEAPASKRPDDSPAETAPQHHRPYASASAASGRLDIRV